MNQSDLLDMLDLGGKGGSDEAAISVSGAGIATDATPASPTALKLDQWGIRRGADLLTKHDRPFSIPGGIANERLPKNERLTTALGADSDSPAPELFKAQYAAADFYGAAFEPSPELVEKCTDQVRHDFLKQLLETTEYKALHTSTMLNESAAEIAATAFAEQCGALKKQNDSKPQGKEKPGDMAKEMATMRAVASAVQSAQDEVTEMQEAASAIGMGGGAPGSNDPRAIAALYRRVRNSPQLRRICELAGRFRRMAQSKQRAKTLHGYDDMVGVVTDGDVGRLLPHELAMLADPEFELDAMRRLVERQSLCREYRGTEPVAKGPIVVVVDESSSMRENRKGDTAKALALAMAWIARHQKRWCALAAFADAGKGRELLLPPGRWDESALMDWLERFIGGGTDCNVPLVGIPGHWNDYAAQGMARGKTDMLIITDGEIRVPEDVRATFAAWKQAEKVRLTTLIIDCRSRGEMEAVSDDVYNVAALDVNDAAVQKCVSI